MPEIVPKDELADYIGKEQPPSEWMRIDQQRIDDFADVSEDHQFIHVDKEKAKQTPFGATIAHGFLTLSLLTHLTKDAGVLPEGVAMGINCGSDRVRFLQPVKVDSEIRAHVKLLEVDEKNPGQILMKSEVTVEIEGEAKPALVAEILSLVFVQ